VLTTINSTQQFIALLQVAVLRYDYGREPSGCCQDRHVSFTLSQSIFTG